MSATVRELNLDGLVGPSHNYAGLSPGNLASEAHRGAPSNPRAAALQGLAKARLLHGLGVEQAFLPPHPRPHFRWLYEQGFRGRPTAVLEQAGRDAPHLLAAAYSASSMWAANAATATPASDSGDGRVHLSAANLASELHRSLEAPYTAALLRALFSDDACFAHHEPLDAALPDEGAANHTRLGADHGEPGVHLLVYGRGEPGAPAPAIYPARQSLAASRAIAAAHELDPGRTVFAQQHPEAIDAGVFHNDVIATGDRDLLLLHERAFLDQSDVIEALQRGVAATGGELQVVEVPASSISLEVAVSSYLFNCQLVALPDGGRAWIGPEECQEHPEVSAFLEELREKAVDALHFVDLRQSMQNGGGPACLRLRVALSKDERDAMAPCVLWSEERDAALVASVEEHYRESLEPADLLDPQFADECLATSEALLEILGLGDDSGLAALFPA